MIADEKIRFCGTLCSAARALGIGGRWDGDDFLWIDPLAHPPSFIKGDKGEDKSETLYNACLALQNYLAPWKQHQPSPSPSSESASEVFSSTSPQTKPESSEIPSTG